MVGTTIEPDFEKIAVTGTELFYHSFYHLVVVGLSIIAKWPFAVYFEIVYTKERIPANAYVNARFDTILAAGVDEVLYNIAFSIPPLYGL